MKLNKDVPNPWQTLNISTRYENPWLKVEHHDAINPAGQACIYGKVHFKTRAVGIIPIDENGYTWLVGQTRYTLNEFSWEIPMGGVPLDETNLAGAQRELLEETGLEAQQWQSLLAIHTSNSVTDEQGEVFVARQLSQQQACPEPSEDIQMLHLPWHQVVEMALEGQITDAISLAAILKLALQCPNLSVISASN
ncbi:NUDIX domain-containing protein [Motilimonas pumila]|uniref:GDP-mannose pyrophosphatase n=1 Tax=Motilimonas pumila TaxID=2303987 RepID=A0A418YBT9_9GAMM|nr:NUDIX hydrolase [Motilimonas pumila]RJG41991.1 NUDIX hydrolase [Motilimonas pumila]